MSQSRALRFFVGYLGKDSLRWSTSVDFELLRLGAFCSMFTFSDSSYIIVFCCFVAFVQNVLQPHHCLFCLQLLLLLCMLFDIAVVQRAKQFHPPGLSNTSRVLLTLYFHSSSILRAVALLFTNTIIFVYSKVYAEYAIPLPDLLAWIELRGLI